MGHFASHLEFYIFSSGNMNTLLSRGRSAGSGKFPGQSSSKCNAITPVNFSERFLSPLIVIERVREPLCSPSPRAKKMDPKPSLMSGTGYHAKARSLITSNENKMSHRADYEWRS